MTNGGANGAHVRAHLCRDPSQRLAMPLTPPRGPYAVSTLTLELPARHLQSFGHGRFQRKLPNGQTEDAFQLETILVTLFYPTARAQQSKSATSSGGQYWLGNSRYKAIKGLLKYAGVSRYFSYPASFLLPYNVRLPYQANGPLAPSSDSSVVSASPRDIFPVGVFSHGLAGTQTTYSAYLAELASEGMVIASVEHRDLSSPHTTVFKTGANDAKELIYTKFDELEVRYDNDSMDNVDTWKMRKAQLDLRQAEMLEAVHVLERINNGDGASLIEENSRDANNLQSLCPSLGEWKGRLDLSRGLWALGHSFGGATCIELLRRTDSPFLHAVVLDPWMEPLTKNECKAPLKRPLYVINSEAFTIWRSNFKQVRQAVAESLATSGSAWLLTITKVKHTDFSDFPFVMPRFFKPSVGGKPPLDVLAVFSRASQMAFSRTFDRQGLGMDVRDERPGEVEARDLGAPGEIIWHDLNDMPTSPRL